MASDVPWTGKGGKPSPHGSCQCWNCGRTNPATCAFCGGCGQGLATQGKPASKGRGKGARGRGAKGTQVDNATNAQRRMANKAHPGTIPEEAHAPPDPTPGAPTADVPGAAHTTPTKTLGARIKSYQQALATAKQCGDAMMVTTLTQTLDGLKSEQEASRPLHRRITSAEANLETEARLVNELGSVVLDLEEQIKETRINLDNARKRKVLAQTCVDELRKDLELQNATNAQTQNPQPAAAEKEQSLTRFLANWQATNNVDDANLDALRLLLQTFTNWQDPGAVDTATPADAQTQINQDLQTHRDQLIAEERTRVKIQTDMKLAEDAAAKLREENEKIEASIRKLQASKDLVTRQARQALAPQPAAAEPKKPPAATRQASRAKPRGRSPAAPAGPDKPDAAMPSGERYIPPHQRNTSKGRMAPKKRAGSVADEQRGAKYFMVDGDA